ncbi:MAG: hypothetical protein HY290_10675 [Planctomycetia bacterium]|nr:hypothetical protein [Planctomycetia bacterium]
MYRLLKIAAPMVLVVAWGVPGYSAEKGVMIPEEDTLEIMLLRQKSVRTELKVTDEVAKRVDEYAAQQWKKAKEVSELPEKEQHTKFGAMAKENQQFLEKNLTKAQRERLDQIVLQVAGLLYVTRHEHADKLKLTADQKQKAKDLQKQARAEMEKLIEAKDAKDRHKEIVALWEVNHGRLEKLLTDSQRATWKQMLGAEFKGEFTHTAANK